MAIKNEQRIAIFTAALEAAQASLPSRRRTLDAHGHWDFITNMWLEDERPELALLPSRMPIEFGQDYIRLIREVYIAQAAGASPEDELERARR